MGFLSGGNTRETIDPGQFYSDPARDQAKEEVDRLVAERRAAWRPKTLRDADKKPSDTDLVSEQEQNAIYARYAAKPAQEFKEQYKPQYGTFTGVQGEQADISKILAGGAPSADQQKALAGQLADMAAGKGPSAAQSQFQSGLDQSIKAAMALGQSAAGVSPGAGLRSILEAQSGIAGRSNADAATLRAQEQQRAISEYGGVLSSMNAEDLARKNAAANVLSQRAGEAQKATEFGTEAGMQMDEAQRRAQIQLEGLRLGAATHDADARAKLFSSLLGAGTSGASMLIPHARGGMIKGHDSEAYDTVPAMLSPGEIVLPRSVSQVEDAPEKAKAFVASIKKRKMAKGGEANNVLLGLRDMKMKLEQLEKMLQK